MNSRILLFAIVLGALITGCTKDPSPSPYDPNADLGVQPVVTSITPEDGPYAISGVTTLAVAGSNFSTDTSKIIVWFDGTPAKILSLDPTLIRVRTPNFYKDSVKVRVSIIGVDKFSETQYLNVKPSFVNMTGIDYTKELPWAVAVDRNENLYVSLTTVGGAGLGVYKIPATGSRTQIALKGSETNYNSLKVGPGDTVYASRGLAALFIFNPTALAAPLIYTRSSTSPPMNNIEDFDFDPQKNIWGGGDLNTGLYRINRAKKAREFAFTGTVHSVRYYNNALYVAAKVGTDEAVYQFPINAADTSLGAAVKYFDLTAQPGYELNTINAITFDSDGRLYVGTDGAAGILVVSSANAVPTPLHNGLIGPKIIKLHWGTGSYLYAVKVNGTAQTLLKIDVQHQSAPYYGRQ